MPNGSPAKKGGTNMTTRYGEDKKRYELIVKEAFDHFANRGWYVKAQPIDSPNGEPDRIGAHVPEIWAKKDDRVIVIAVETCGSIDSQDAKFRFKEFARPEDSEFHVAIPEKCKLKAKETADKWNIPVKKFWTFSKY